MESLGELFGIAALFLGLQFRNAAAFIDAFAFQHSEQVI